MPQSDPIYKTYDAEVRARLRWQETHAPRAMALIRALATFDCWDMRDLRWSAVVRVTSELLTMAEAGQEPELSDEVMVRQTFGLEASA